MIKPTETEPNVEIKNDEQTETPSKDNVTFDVSKKVPRKCCQYSCMVLTFSIIIGLIIWALYFAIQKSKTTTKDFEVVGLPVPSLILSSKSQEKQKVSTKANPEKFFDDQIKLKPKDQIKEKTESE